MISLQIILSAIFRSASTILNTAFGWATIMLFGKVPENRQTQLSILTFGSVLWLLVTISIPYPKAGVILLVLVPIPDFIHEWVRAIMIVLSALLPIAIGITSLYIVDKSKRPKGAGPVTKAILKGYPYAFGLSLTLLMMIVISPPLKIRDIVRRRQDAHVPMIVEGADYFDVVNDVQRVLRRGGFETERDQANILLRLPTKVFTLFAGSAVDRLIADQLAVLKSPQIEVLLHPSDLVISGKEHDIAHIRALLAESLTFTKAYQTWTAEANKIEDRLAGIWKQIKTDEGKRAEQLLEELAATAHDLKTGQFTFDEWQVLFREQSIIERKLLRLLAGVDEEATSACR